MTSFVAVYSEYTNCIEFLVKTGKTAAKSAIKIFKKQNAVQFEFGDTYLLKKNCIADLSPKNIFVHSFAEISAPYLYAVQGALNEDGTRAIFSPANGNLLSNFAILATLTTKSDTKNNFANLGLLEYNKFTNTVIIPSNFMGSIGYQYITAIKTLACRGVVACLKTDANIFYCKELYDTLQYNVETISAILIKNKIIQTTNIADLVTAYTTIFKYNMFFMENFMEKKIALSVKEYENTILAANIQPKYNPEEIIRVILEIKCSDPAGTNTSVKQLITAYTEIGIFENDYLNSVDTLKEAIYSSNAYQKYTSKDIKDISDILFKKNLPDKQ